MGMKLSKVGKLLMGELDFHPHEVRVKGTPPDRSFLPHILMLFGTWRTQRALAMRVGAWIGNSDVGVIVDEAEQ